MSHLLGRKPIDTCENTAFDAIRPGIPPFLLIALALWGGCALFFTLISWEGLPFKHISLVGGVMCALMILFGCVASRFRIVLLCVGAAVFGVVLASFYLQVYWTSYEELKSDSKESLRYEFKMEEDASLSQFGSQCITSTKTPSGRIVSILLYLEGEHRLLRGERIIADTSILVLDDAYLEMYRQQGVIAKASVKSFDIISGNFLTDALLSARGRAIELFEECGSECTGILQALVCGYRNTIEENGQYDAFKVCGLAHIVAVSGAHLAIVAALFGMVLTRLRASRLVTIVLVSAIICAYLVFAGIPISAIRAAVMVILSLFAFTAKRRNAPLNALGICLTCIILTDAKSAVSVSLFLSASSTLGIILFASLIASWFGSIPRVVDAAIVKPLSLTASSNIAALPFSAALFSQLSVVAPLANICAAPLFSIACIAGLIGVLIGMMLPCVAPCTIGIAALLASPLIIIVDLLSSIPYACVAVALPVIPMIALSVIGMMLLYNMWPKIRLRQLIVIGIAFTAILSGFIFFRLPAGDRICMLDVGQGDSFLMESGGLSVLVDTGNHDMLLKEAVAEHKVNKLDAVFITHADDDHCGCLESLSKYVNIDCVYVAADMLDCPCKKCSELRSNILSVSKKDPVGLHVGDVVEIGNFQLDIVWPDSFSDEGGNADSLCFTVKADVDNDGEVDARAFFCGDAEVDQIAQMAEKGRIEDVDILKVGHHGSRVSVDDGVLDILKPECALIGVGERNRYGHPTSDALTALENAGAIIYRSDFNGCVDITIKKDGLIIHSEK